jgi:hypothetical protein
VNRHGLADITALSCGTPGNCAAGGYTTVSPQTSTITLSRPPRRTASGATRRGYRGLAALGSVDSLVDYVNCWPAAGCIAIGNYQTRTGLSFDGYLFVTARR